MYLWQSLIYYSCMARVVVYGTVYMLKCTSRYRTFVGRFEYRIRTLDNTAVVDSMSNRRRTLSLALVPAPIAALAAAVPAAAALQ